MQYECDTSDTIAAQVRYEQHKCDTSATLATRVQHKCDTNDTSATRVKNFDFDGGMSKNIFSHPYIYYMVRERLQGEEQFPSKNYFLEMSFFHDKMRLKSAPKKTKPFNGKSYIKKLYTRLKVRLRWAVFEIVFTSAIMCI